MITVSKRIEFDAGHRVPSHGGKCRHPHGHRYAVEAEVVGEVVQAEGDPADGMVTDFGALKDLLMKLVHDRWDHSFLVYHRDIVMRDFLWQNEFKHDVLPLVPTAENLAFMVAQWLEPELEAHDLMLLRLTVWETPTCSAVWVR